MPYLWREIKQFYREKVRATFGEPPTRGAGLDPVLLLSEGAGAGTPPVRQLATKAGGWRLAGGSDAADGGGALSDCSDSEGSVSDSSGLTLGSVVVTGRSVLPKRLNHSDSGKLHGAAFLGFSFMVYRELFKEEATASH